MAEGAGQSWWSILRWPIALGVLAWLVAANSEGVRDLVASGVRWRWIAAAAGMRVISILLATARWNKLLRGQEIHRPYTRVLRLFASGYVCNFLLPGTLGGDMARAGMIAVDSPQQRMRGAATVPLDRMLGLLAFISVGALAGLSQWSEIPQGLLRSCVVALVVVGGAGLTGLAALLLLRFPPRRSRAESIPGSEESPPPTDSQQRRRALGHELLYGLALLRDSRGAVLAAFALAAIGHSLLAMSMYSCLRAFPAADIPAGAIAHLWIVPSAEVPASVLPLPGGVGAREGALALLYGALADDPTTAERYRQVGVVTAATFSTASVCVAALVAAWLAMTGGRRLPPTAD
jgi:glycosyltransferase 2 family protein